MRGYVLQYNKKTNLCREIIEFPEDAGKAANWNSARYEEELGEDFQVELFFANIRDGITSMHFCIMHDESNPVPFRPATAEELELNSRKQFEQWEESRAQ